MRLGGELFTKEEVFERVLTIPDSFVVRKNKIDDGRESHGEAKFYVASKNTMRSFFGAEGFKAKCFFLKTDLLNFLDGIQSEYINPSLCYRGADELPTLWQERKKQIEAIDGEIVTFTIEDQVQIDGTRGYINSKDKMYGLLRELSLPLVSYLQILRLKDKVGEPLFYFKLFVDFDAIYQRKSQPLVFTYGRKEKNAPAKVLAPVPEVSKTKGRDGQAKYRAQLLEQCPFCPITGVADDRLLIASHIKPWAVSNEKERTDPHNGYMLTPTYDYLFDKGFITFTSERRMQVSNFLSNVTCERLGLKDDLFIQRLPLDEKRKKYLEYHCAHVFKG